MANDFKSFFADASGGEGERCNYTTRLDTYGCGKFCVYKHTLSDGRAYIGITSQPTSRRWRPNGEGYVKSSYFYNAIQKYGWGAFEHEVLFSGLTEKEAKAKERELVAEFRTNEREFGFNLTDGGDSVRKMTEEERREHGRRMSEINRGRHHSEETKRKMSEHMMGEKNPNYGGKAITPEMVEKIRELGKRPKSKETRNKMSAAAKKHRVVCVETGEVFESMKAAASAKGIGYTTVTCAVYDPHRRAGGFHWATAPEGVAVNG